MAKSNEEVYEEGTFIKGRVAQVPHTRRDSGEEREAFGQAVPMMVRRLPSFILGFHGCDRRIANRIVSTGRHLNPSVNDYDWLGHGIYFWENSSARAIQWAMEQGPRKNSGKFTPAVIGAVIDLGNCLNLLDSGSIPVLREGYEYLKAVHSRSGTPMPTNQNPPKRRDYLLRRLDCAVVNSAHQIILEQNGMPFDSVRAAFIEGEMIYPQAGFRDKNHIQICVRNPACIKGYFHVLEPS